MSVDHSERRTSQLPGHLMDPRKTRELGSSPLSVAEVVNLAHANNCLYVTNAVTWAECINRAYAVIPEDDLWVVRWALEGQATGHVWCECDVCGEPRLMKPRRHRCVTAPVGNYRRRVGAICPGSMQPIVRPPRLTQTVKRNLGRLS